MDAKIILNPYANRWKAKKSLPLIAEQLSRTSIPFDLIQSDHPGHCEELAHAAVKDGFELIVAAGGDGTINEVVNGMLRVGESDDLPHLSIIPIGTANDFVANLGLKPDLASAVERIKSLRSQKVDLCSLNNRFFVNNAGLGLEPYITTIQQRMTRVSGIVRYLLATLVGIADNPQWDMDVSWDTGHYQGPVTMVSIGNGARTGGIFFTTPGADPCDGKVDFLFGSIPSRAGILKALPMILKENKGNIGEHPAMRLHKTASLTVATSKPTPSHADGELNASWETEFQFGILPGKLSLVVD